jgi:hypothetical protein
MRGPLLVLACVLLPQLALAQAGLLEQGQRLLGPGNPVPGLGTTAPAPSSGSGLSPSQIGGGLKEALSVGAQRTVGRVGRSGGYMNDPSIRIPLPGALESVRPALAMVGGSQLVDDLQLKMNRAAEAAAPKALDIFTDAISKMSITDAQQILQGPNDAATQYFKRNTTRPLTQAFTPIVDHSLADVGAVQAMGAVTQKTAAIPGAGMGNFGLTDFVVEKALAGLFHYIAQEEAAIRTNPAARSTELLKTVFGR